MEVKGPVITEELLESYRNALLMEEKSLSTVEKYVRDVRKLMKYAGGRPLTKELMIGYKKALQYEYKVSSVNSYIVAASGFLAYIDCEKLKVQTLRVQKRAFYPEEKCLTKAEFHKLVKTARLEGHERLAAILNTVACTGIRISELRYITVESLKEGRVIINLKGKTRIILMSRELVALLKQYCEKNRIGEGIIFKTSGGKPVNRSNIWKEMKLIGKRAKIKLSKVYPHSLRHLFAQCFYEEGKDIAKLADVLGHSSIETTRIYIMTTGKEHRRYLEKMKMLCD